MLDYNVPGGVCRNMIYNQLSTLFNLTLCAIAFSLLDWIVGRKAEPRTICHWQLQVTERRKGTNKWWGFSRMRAWLVHWMGMATEYFFSLLADPDFITHDNYYNSCFTFVASKFLSHLNNESCSFKHIFLFLMTSWTILLHAVVNLAGSGNLRCFSESEHFPSY